MDLIYTDKNYKEIGYLKQCEVDFEIGSSILSNARNDFTITIHTESFPKEIEEGALIYEVGSEFGGVVDGIGVNTATDKITIYGTLWRGMLSRKIIVPPKEQAYYQARGEANEAINKLVGDKFDGLIACDGIITDIIVNRDFRFTNMLQGIEKMLNDRGARLNIKTAYSNRNIKAIMSAVRINNYSNEIELSNDYGITLNAKKVKSGVNHVICLGKGELLDRTVIHLYKHEDGSIDTDSTNAILGKNERAITYDYSSAETEDELIEGGLKKFTEQCDSESMSIEIGTNVEIGDVVAARERITGIYMQKSVTQKIAKGNINHVKIDYKVGE